MPTNHVNVDRMSPGGKAGGKRWTKAEIDARQNAAEKLTRKTKVRLKAPDWLGKDALITWKRIIKQTKDMELLDNLDENLLAIYCDAYCKYKYLSMQPGLEMDDIKNLQAWARLLAVYGDKLGLTPAGRARLAKRAADKSLDEFGGEFD